MALIRLNTSDPNNYFLIESTKIDAYVINTDTIEIYYAKKRVENVQNTSANRSFLTTPLPPQLRTGGSAVANCYVTVARIAAYEINGANIDIVFISDSTIPNLATGETVASLATALSLSVPAIDVAMTSTGKPIRLTVGIKF